MPFVSVIIPCRDEENFIGVCLDSIIASDYPKDKLEVLVVDGLSEDGTREIVEGYAQRYPFIRLLDNPDKITPCALNLGIKHAKGEIIMIMGAHATYEGRYVSKCIKYLKEYNADNVGGISITLPGSDSLVGNAIALVLSSPFGVGNAYFRIGSKEPRYVDTVPFGCYKKEVFERIGLFDEDLVRNQDDEFNLRVIKNGGRILLVPEIVSYYYARDSLAKLWNMYFQYGYFKPLVAQKIGAVLTWRQLIPAVFVGSLVLAGLLSFLSNYCSWLFFLIMLLYLSANLAFSLSTAIRKGLKLLPALILSFATLHFSYGVGYLKGIWDFVILKKHLKRKVEDMPITR
ncbi:MAG: glycosyltransferase family 2 protein [Candidatus Omnitrophica bacterium]|nr:glycosyltransferase family 2 protein [Candidatus Omnitrophota bacterium]